MFNSTKIYIFLACTFVLVTALLADEGSVINEDIQASPNFTDTERNLQIWLDKFNVNGFYYRVSKVHSYLDTYDDGAATIYNVDLINADNIQENCKVTTWTRGWSVDGKRFKVIFECPGKGKVEKRL